MMANSPLLSDVYKRQLSPSGEREETALLGARNRFALRLAEDVYKRQEAQFVLLLQNMNISVTAISTRGMTYLPHK